MNSKVSIIIPIYNSRKYLSTCINSILEQTYQNIEIIIIDDGSTDNSKKIVEEYIRENNLIKYFYKKNGGVSSARNMGIEKATGKYLFFVDSDDMIEKDAINKCMELINEYDYLFVKRINNKAKYKNKNIVCEIPKEEFIESVIKNKINGFVCCGIYNKKIIGNLRFDQEISFMEDTLFLLQYISKLKTIGFVDYSCANYHYIENENSITNTKKVNNHITDFCKSLDKINTLTSMKYSKQILKRKINLIEKECRFLSDKSEYDEILKREDIRDSIKNSFSLFSVIYCMKSSTMLALYYKLRKILKTIYHRFRG